MKYSVGRETKTGRFVTITRRDGKAGVEFRRTGSSNYEVPEGTVDRAKAAANTALSGLDRKR